MKKSTYVEPGFSAIAKRYDLFNDLVTFGLHRLWKKRVAVEALAAAPARVLDACCGTGDIAEALEHQSRKQGLSTEITGLDFSQAMLDIASERANTSSRIKYIRGDALNTGLPNEHFGAVTIGFGLRNVDDIQSCLKEFRRLLVPGGKLVVLDMGKPTLPLFKTLYNFFFFRIVPKIGKLLLPGQDMFDYFPRSTLDYPDPKKLSTILSDAGFSQTTYNNILLGSVCIHTASK